MHMAEFIWKYFANPALLFHHVKAKMMQNRRTWNILKTFVRILHQPLFLELFIYQFIFNKSAGANFYLQTLQTRPA